MDKRIREIMKVINKNRYLSKFFWSFKWYRDAMKHQVDKISKTHR